MSSVRTGCYTHSPDSHQYHHQLNNYFFCINSLNSSNVISNRNPNNYHSLRSRAFPKSRGPKPSTQVDSPDIEPDQNPPPTSLTLSSSISSILGRFREAIKVDEIALDIMSIALPAVLALAADPITSLVDTAFVGHLGSVELAAVGISVSVFNLVSKLLNVPLLNVTTSFVAEEESIINFENNESVQGGLDVISDDGQVKRLLPSVSTSLALAAGIGFAEALALSVGPGFLMNIMGISADSPLRMPAEQFLMLKAFGAPAIVIALAAQGIFRGFKDTKTPLYAIGAGNLLNAILDPILIFLLGYGIGGAAIATVISEYLTACILLWKLNQRVKFIAPNIEGERVLRYLKSGGLLICRTLAVLVTMTTATSMAAKQGPVPMAGHQICIEVWLTISLLTDALALAGQAILASEYSLGNYDLAREVIYRVLQIGLVTGIGLAVILFAGFGYFSSLFTTDAEVLEVARSGILFVAGSQPINAIAFVLDGLYYGVSDFGYAAYSTFLASLISSIFLLVAAPVFGLAGVWAGLFLFMSLRVVAGGWRLGTKGGPWTVILSDTNSLGE